MEESTGSTSFLMEDHTNTNLFPVKSDLSTLYSERKEVISEKPSKSKRQTLISSGILSKSYVQLRVGSYQAANTAGSSSPAGSHEQGPDTIYFFFFFPEDTQWTFADSFFPEIRCDS